MRIASARPRFGLALSSATVHLIRTRRDAAIGGVGAVGASLDADRAVLQVRNVRRLQELKLCRHSRFGPAISGSWLRERRPGVVARLGR